MFPSDRNFHWNGATKVASLALRGQPSRVCARSGPLAVGYYDPVDGANVILATIRDCSGRLAAPNVIIFDHAFEGIKASIRITYRKAGISQDLLLHEAPPPPEKFGLSARSRLELYTEFRPETPAPRQSVVMLRAESDPQVRQDMVEPDLTDRLLDFGAYKMGTGLAFEGEGKAGTQKLPVMKRYEMIDGRPVLIEAVEYQSAKDLLSMLPPGPAAPRQARAQIRHSPLGTQRPLLARALRSKPRPNATVKPIQEARLREGESPLEPTKAGAKSGLGRSLALPTIDFEGPTFVLDYSLVTGATNFTFTPDVTWFVSGNVYLYGTTRFLGGTVIKYTNFTTTPSLRLRGHQSVLVAGPDKNLKPALLFTNRPK